MKSTPLPGVSTWGRFQEDRRVDFNGFLIERPQDGNVLVDPMPLDDGERAHLDGLGGAEWILLTNADHLRATADLAGELDASVCAPAPERGRLGPAADRVDFWFEPERGILPAQLGTGIHVAGIRGGKSPVEAVFLLDRHKALVFGDIVRTDDKGRLMLLTPEKTRDRDELLATLMPLARPEIEWLLLGDGKAVVENGGHALKELLDREAGAEQG